MEIMFLDSRLKTFEPETELSAGYDLRCCENEEVIILPGQTVKVHTGIAVHMGESYDHLPSNRSEYCAVIMPRSSLGCRGIKPKNAPGLIDADYQGEIMLCMTNESEEFVTIQPMDRIAQLVFMIALRPRFMSVTNFSTDTNRGINGLGSTGVN